MSAARPIQVASESVVVAKSCHLVSTGSQQAEAFFLWFGIFAPDCPISAEVFVAVWNIPSAETYRLLDFFSGTFVIDSVPESPQCYSILRATHTAAQALWNSTDLGLTVCEAHAQIVSACFALSAAEIGSLMPAGEYIYRQLLWHIEQSGRHDLLHTLLQQKLSTGQNSWFTACRQFGRPDLFTQALNKGQQYAASSSDAIAEAVILQCRYTLIYAILRAQASNLPVHWLGLLLKHQIWSLPQVFNELALLADPHQKVAAIRAVAPILPESAFLSLLTLIAEICSDAIQSQALSGIANHVPESCLGDVLCLIQGIVDERYKAMLLKAFQNWPPDLISAALETVLKLKDEIQRTNVLLAWIPVLSQDLLAQINQVAQKTSDPIERTLLLVLLMSRGVGQTQRVIGFCSQLSSEQHSELQIRLAQFNLKVPSSLQRLSQRQGRCDAELSLKPAADLSRSVKVDAALQEFDRVLAAIALIAQDSQGAPEVHDFLLHLWDTDALCLALSHLAPKLSLETLEAVIEKVCVTNNAGAIAAVRVAIARQRKEYLPAAIAALEQIQEIENRIAVFIPLLGSYPELAQELYRLTVSLENEEIQSIRLSEIAEFLTVEDRSDALRRAIEMSSALSRNLCLNGLAPFLTAEQLRWGLERLSTQSIVQTLENTGKQFMAYSLESLEGPQSPESQSQSALFGPHSVQSCFVPDTISSDILKAIFEIPNSFYRANALRGVLHQLQTSQVDAALLLQLLTELSPGDGIETMKVLPLLAPVISNIAEPAALKQIAESCQELGQQFGQPWSITLQSMFDISDKVPFREGTV